VASLTVASLPEQTEPSASALSAVFAEVNEHLRKTEEKHLAITVGYLGALALGLSIMASSGSGSGAAVPFSTWPHVIAYGVLITVGCMAIFVQDAYRGWKQYYKLVLQRIVEEWGFEPGTSDRFLPQWLRQDSFDHPAVLRLSADNALTYFTAVATTFLVIVFEIMIANLLVLPWGGVAIGMTAAIYIVYLTGLRARVMRRKEELEEARESDHLRTFST
jgi:hypothetical protein